MHGNESDTSWNEPLAVALMVEADSLVEGLGVSGLDPEIVACAGEVVAAHKRRDMASVTVACRMVCERARALANPKALTRSPA
ncbi:unnamed protein product [Gemmataceae bacterium]|nr:unnamed protein product [Gemmataceae bacterium]VTU01343.1 unnamed protein product [Gemmataceae bacterium]